MCIHRSAYTGAFLHGSYTFHSCDRRPLARLHGGLICTYFFFPIHFVFSETRMRETRINISTLYTPRYIIIRRVEKDLSIWRVRLEKKFYLTSHPATLIMGIPYGPYSNRIGRLSARRVLRILPARNEKKKKK